MSWNRGAAVRQALGNAALRRVLAGYLLFNVAEWATWIALLVWGYSVGGVRGSSAIALVQLVPGAWLAAPAAALLGRLPNGRALWISYAAQAVAYLVVGVVLLGGAPVAVVGAAAPLAMVSISLTRPVHYALLPQISRTTADLTAGNAASGSLEALAAFAGPLTSGLLLALWSVGGVFIAMSLFLAFGVLLTAAVVTGPRLAMSVGAGTDRRAESAIGTTILRNPAARLMSVLITAQYALVGMMDILLVALAIEVLHMSEAGPGVLNSAIGVGGIAGAALTFTLVGRSSLAGPLVLGALGAGLGFALAGQAPAARVAFVLLVISGAGQLFYAVASRTFVQRLLPDHQLTAMFGLQESFMLTGIAFGTLAAPALVEVLGTRSAFLAGGCFLPLLALASYTALHRLDADAVVPVDVLELLMGVPTLAVLAPRIVERLARDAVVEDVRAGTSVVRQGEVGHRFYVIAKGLVSVDMDGTQIRQLGPGDWFGEIALLRDVPRTASVTTLTEVSLRGIDREHFLASVMTLPRSVEVADSHIRDRYA